MNVHRLDHRIYNKYILNRLNAYDDSGDDHLSANDDTRTHRIDRMQTRASHSILFRVRHDKRLEVDCSRTFSNRTRLVDLSYYY